MSVVDQVVIAEEMELTVSDVAEIKDVTPPPQKKPVNELVSVVIPVASWDKEWKKLLPDLATLPEGTEIIFSVSEKDSSFGELPRIVDNLKGKRVKWVRSESGRAKCLNTGADAATGKYIWFLHADSRFAAGAYKALEESIKKHPNGLHYFNLRFLSDGPNLMVFNEIGAKIRSAVFGAPFGDQGLCVKHETFKYIGGFPEDAEYGEDHLFVWHAKQNRIKLYSTGESLLTSARKYKKNGWLNVTLRYQKIWISQAWPEWKKLIKSA